MADPSRVSFNTMHEQRDWLHVTLTSIGDAVITTDALDRVTFLNPVAEALTGWTNGDAAGQSLSTVIGFLNEESRQPVEIPSVEALREGRTKTLASHSLLTAKDGTERSISDSAALIKNDEGKIAGLVLVFRDITERRESERALAKALAYAEDIIATLREPFVVLDHDLRVRTANLSFYSSFRVSKENTENCFVYDLGNGQWDIPALRTLLDRVLSRNEAVHDFEVEHSFPTLGQKSILLNARPFPPNSKHPELILLAIEDITDRKHAEDRLEVLNFAHGREHERKRVAQRLHDHLQQLLIAAKMRVGLATAKQRDSRMRSALADTEKILQEAIDASRNLAVELNPPVLFQSGLVPALNWLVDWMHQTHEFELRVDVSTKLSLAYSDVAVFLFEVVRELLLNAVKHSGVKQAFVRVEQPEAGMLRVVVRDEGAGFTSAKAHAESGPIEGFGIASIRHQVEALEGKFQIESVPEKGTSVAITIPIIKQKRS